MLFRSAYLDESKPLEEELDSLFRQAGEDEEWVVFSDLLGGSIMTKKRQTVQSVRGSQARQGIAGLRNGDFNVLALQRLHDLLRHILIRDHLMNRGRRDDT